MHTYISSSSSCTTSMDFPDSLANCPHHPSLPAGPPDDIMCPYRVVVDMFFVIDTSSFM